VHPIWKRIEQPSIVACGGCHQNVYEEWATSLHHGAWSNQNVRTATNDFANKKCRACHSPMPVLLTGLDRRPKFRDFNQHDGVHCLSCHGLEDGVAAARTILDAPCRPRFEPRLQQAEMCYPCHEPTHQAFAEYRRSDAAATGVRCVDCHMQPTTHRSGRSHGPHGGFDAEFVKRAVAWRCWVADRKLHVELRNRTGHKFPGEIPSRSFHVHVSFVGDPAQQHEPVHELLRRPFKKEARRDNRLAPDEVRVLHFPLPAGATDVVVRLLFKPLPLMPDEDAFVIGEWASESARRQPPRK
jgi:nitrate/TMAO reductase-like tetraheme cytochrome c subunit